MKILVTGGAGFIGSHVAARFLRDGHEVSLVDDFNDLMKIIEEDDNIFIAIFLSPFDIHYQFSPVSGTIQDIKYDRTGKFSLAYELNKSN